MDGFPREVIARQAEEINNLKAENAKLKSLLTEARANLYDMCDAAIVYRIDEALKETK